MKKLMPSEGLRLGCSSGSTRCVIAKNYVLGQPGGGWPCEGSQGFDGFGGEAGDLHDELGAEALGLHVAGGG